MSKETKELKGSYAYTHDEFLEHPGDPNRARGNRYINQAITSVGNATTVYQYYIFDGEFEIDSVGYILTPPVNTQNICSYNAHVQIRRGQGDTFLQHVMTLVQSAAPAATTRYGGDVLQHYFHGYRFKTVKGDVLQVELEVIGAFGVSCMSQVMWREKSI